VQAVTASREVVDATIIYVANPAKALVVDGAPDAVVARLED